MKKTNSQIELIKSSESEPLIVETNTVSFKRKFPKYHSNNFKMKHHRILIFSSIFVLLLFIHLILFSNVKIYNKREVIGWSKNTSRDIAEYILPNENTTLIDSTVCITDDPLLLLIVVCSSAENYEARQTIRETWGNTSQFNYQLFDKFHGSHNGSFLNVDDGNWRDYAEVSKQFTLLQCILLTMLYNQFTANRYQRF